MYNFVVLLKDPAVNLILGFKEKGMADVSRVNVRSAIDDWQFKQKDSRVTVKDDYGHELDMFASNIAGVLIQDQKLCMERNNDQNIDTARANDVFIKRRNEDMELMRLFPSNQPMMASRA